MHEDESTPGAHAGFMKPKVPHAQALALGQERSGAELARQRIGPCVVRATDRATEPARRPGDRDRCARSLVQHELRSAMSAHVVEGPKATVSDTNHEDALGRRLHAQVVAGVWNDLLAADAEPFGREDALTLRFELL